jgi:hypothetical protein
MFNVGCIGSRVNIVLKRDKRRITICTRHGIHVLLIGGLTISWMFPNRKSIWLAFLVLFLTVITITSHSCRYSRR